ncbi:MAG: hypothetical protein AUH30_02145 [Candidatus Rokubacteria bacterium 13_1_40CM_68_15]|nr:MAG: hypothetical protein AUH30_02145 [Candidatus Rokubacteria bacterium 13_1_40CM_68_15]
MTALRPAEICRELLGALEVSEGRRKRRQRDTTPDAIGLGIKRHLLERAVQDDPGPDDFEGWLLERCGEAESEGGVRAMALQIFDEWRMASAVATFSDWLTHGAPSDDRQS